VLFLSPTTPAHRAATYATVMNARRIVVVDGGHIVGIVSAIDLAALLGSKRA
jgi:CBS domain-containing protein